MEISLLECIIYGFVMYVLGWFVGRIVDKKERDKDAISD